MVVFPKGVRACYEAGQPKPKAFFVPNHNTMEDSRPIKATAEPYESKTSLINPSFKNFVSTQSSELMTALEALTTVFYLVNDNLINTDCDFLTESEQERASTIEDELMKSLHTATARLEEYLLYSVKVHLKECVF